MTDDISPEASLSSSVSSREEVVNGVGSSEWHSCLRAEVLPYKSPRNHKA